VDSLFHIRIQSLQDVHWISLHCVSILYYYFANKNSGIKIIIIFIELRNITLSGLLLFPYAIGPAGNFGMLFICILYHFPPCPLLPLSLSLALTFPFNLAILRYCTLEALFSAKKGEDLISISPKKVNRVYFYLI
jgi:hypothetical protein